MVEAALVGEVVGKAVGGDDGGGRLHAEEAPSAAAEVGEAFILSGHGSHGGGSVVTGHGDDGDGREARGFLHLRREGAHLLAGLYKAAETVAREAETAQQGGVEVARAGIQHLGRGGHCIFADGLTGEHVDEGIGDEENLVGIL